MSYKKRITEDGFRRVTEDGMSTRVLEDSTGPETAPSGGLFTRSYARRVARRLRPWLMFTRPFRSRFVSR